MNFNPRSIDIDSNRQYKHSIDSIDIEVFINESLCRYYKFLWRKCKKLWDEKWIEAFWVSKGQIKFRTEPEGAVSQISLTQDLQKLLPDYNFQFDQFSLLSILI